MREGPRLDDGNGSRRVEQAVVVFRRFRTPSKVSRRNTIVAGLARMWTPLLVLGVGVPAANCVTVCVADCFDVPVGLDVSAAVGVDAIGGHPHRWFP